MNSRKDKVGVSMMLCQLSRWRGQLQVEQRWAFYWLLLKPHHLTQHINTQFHCISTRKTRSSACIGLKRKAHTAERKTQRSGPQKESGHGPDPKLFDRNLGSPGYQPGAPLSVSNCSGL